MTWVTQQCGSQHNLGGKILNANWGGGWHRWGRWQGRLWGWGSLWEASWMRAVKACTVHWMESTIAHWTETGEATGGGGEWYGGGQWGGLLHWQQNISGIWLGPTKSLCTMSSNFFNVARLTFSSHSKYWHISLSIWFISLSWNIPWVMIATDDLRWSAYTIK